MFVLQSSVIAMLIERCASYKGEIRSVSLNLWFAVTAMLLYIVVPILWIQVSPRAGSASDLLDKYFMYPNCLVFSVFVYFGFKLVYVVTKNSISPWQVQCF